MHSSVVELSQRFKLLRVVPSLNRGRQLEVRANALYSTII